MLTRRFQEDIPLQMYVYPGDPDGQAARRSSRSTRCSPRDPFSLSASAIGAHRNDWIDEWTRIVLR